MAQTKIEKIASIEEEIKQLKERQKLLLQQHNAQERKDRTKRFCKRAGLLESLLPNTITLTDEQFKKDHHHRRYGGELHSPHPCTHGGE